MRLQRHTLGRDGAPTLGVLTSRDGEFSCVTLERSANGDHPCVPASEYPVGYETHHPGGPHPYRCPVLDTRAIGRSHIQIHIANCCDELLGCIAVGEYVDGARIAASGDAFQRLMDYLAGVPSFTLEILDPPAHVA